MNQIQWYPGHIAKAERQLKEQLKRVDVVLEVRDARIPLATHHPQLAQWMGDKSRVLVLNRLDCISPTVRDGWQTWFQSQGDRPYFTNAQHGTGVEAVSKAAQQAGEAVNRRRRDRGMLPRAVRAVVIGFPNVGKSALINRLLKRRVVESARRPGVTRQLRWVRISDRLELLDAPGILPWKLENQAGALKLAICDDIGEAAYDLEQVAKSFVELVRELGDRYPDLMPDNPLQTRYGIDPEAMSAEDYLYQLAQHRASGDIGRTAKLILTDFRKGLLGSLPLELPPQS
ncbi:MAG: ribosome biogenesis GTPase YlqF [Geitlerinemataceae cyanobacterium]